MFLSILRDSLTHKGNNSQTVFKLSVEAHLPIIEVLIETLGLRGFLMNGISECCWQVLERFAKQFNKHYAPNLPLDVDRNTEGKRKIVKINLFEILQLKMCLSTLKFDIKINPSTG